MSIPSALPNTAAFISGPGRLGLWLVAAGMGASIAGCAGMQGRSPADPGAVARGAALAARGCGSCHGLGIAGESQFPRAPAFRDMRVDLDAISYQRRMAELHLGEVKMPPAEISLRDVSDIRAYVRSLKRSNER